MSRPTAAADLPGLTTAIRSTGDLVDIFVMVMEDIVVPKMSQEADNYYLMSEDGITVAFLNLCFGVCEQYGFNVSNAENSNGKADFVVRSLSKPCVTHPGEAKMLDPDKSKDRTSEWYLSGLSALTKRFVRLEGGFAVLACWCKQDIETKRRIKKEVFEFRWEKALPGRESPDESSIFHSSHDTPNGQTEVLHMWLNLYSPHKENALAAEKKRWKELREARRQQGAGGDESN